MKYYPDVIYFFGLIALSVFPIVSSISTSPNHGSVCYSGVEKYLWRLVRADDVPGLALLLGGSTGESPEVDLKSHRFSCLQNQSLLHQAAAHGAGKAIRWLLARGLDIEARDDEQRTPLLVAAFRGQSKSARVLLEQKADRKARDGRGRGLLHLAAGGGYPRLLERLLRRLGTSAASGEVNSRDLEGDSPLHRAALSGSAEAVRHLLRAGAEVNSTNNQGETPLHVAIFHRRLEAAKALLEGGADPNAPLPDGQRPLHLVASSNGQTIARLLLDRGALVNPGGLVKSPLALAMESGRGAMVELLKSRGATDLAPSNRWQTG